MVAVREAEAAIELLATVGLCARWHASVWAGAAWGAGAALDAVGRQGQIRQWHRWERNAGGGDCSMWKGSLRAKSLAQNLEIPSQRIGFYYPQQAFCVATSEVCMGAYQNMPKEINRTSNVKTDVGIVQSGTGGQEMEHLAQTQHSSYLGKLC